MTSNKIVAALKEWRDARLELFDYLNHTEWNKIVEDGEASKKDRSRDHWIRLANAEWNLYKLAIEELE